MLVFFEGPKFYKVLIAAYTHIDKQNEISKKLNVVVWYGDWKEIRACLGSPKIVWPKKVHFEIGSRTVERDSEYL